MKRKTKTRRKVRRNVRTCKSNIAGGPKSPLNWLGNPNRMWIKEKNLHAHSTFVVDPRGTGTYCHSTIRYPGDSTKYHYGYEVRNRRNRDKGKFFWTTPYEDEYKLTPSIRVELERLYSELCDEDNRTCNDRWGDYDTIRSRHSSRRRTRTRSRSRSPRRAGKKTRSRYKNR